MRGWFKGLVGLVVGGVLLAVVAAQVEWDKVEATILASEPLWLIPIGVVLTIHYALKGVRWRVLLSGSSRVSVLFSIRLTMVGFLMNNIFPARIGELGRPYLLSANDPGVPFTFALATVVGDKLFDLFLVVVCLLVSSVVLPLPGYAVTGIAILCTVCLAGLGAALYRNRTYRTYGTYGTDGTDEMNGTDPGTFAPHGTRSGFRGVVGQFADGLATVASVKRGGLALVCSVGAFGFLASAAYMTLLMLNLDGSLAVSLFVIGMVGIGFMIPSPPTNAGSFHFFAAQALLLSGAAAADAAFSFALISHISQVAVVTLTGALSLVGLDWKRVRNDHP